ncbi:MAG: 3-isopropylmalate dehydratase small subunit [Firmicutes bacterium]|nr:3-isopropylmalate dehydratase small subunit [Alicyclobacillaceae bacterium]MCL6497624.1 3-isopropylmalate dehydratase small subunit [Bacillota bacterium]
MEVRGRCWKFGDNIPTDQIVRSDRALAPMEEIVRHVLETLNPAFAREVKPGDILVAGKHFGQSSGRAIAPKALRATGIGAVVVEYAARLFYRNCFEIGLPLLECPGITAGVEDGDVLAVDIAAGTIRNETRGRVFYARPVDPFLRRMLQAGGIIPLAAELAEE